MNFWRPFTFSVLSGAASGDHIEIKSLPSFAEKNWHPVVSFLNPSGTGNIQVKAVTATVFTPSNVLQLKVTVPYTAAYMKKVGKPEMLETLDSDIFRCWTNYQKDKICMLVYRRLWKKNLISDGLEF